MLVSCLFFSFSSAAFFCCSAWMRVVATRPSADSLAMRWSTTYATFAPCGNGFGAGGWAGAACAGAGAERARPAPAPAGLARGLEPAPGQTRGRRQHHAERHDNNKAFHYQSFQDSDLSLTRQEQPPKGGRSSVKYPRF